VRIILRPLRSNFELCARLGLVFAPLQNPTDIAEHASACAKLGLASARPRSLIDFADQILSTRAAARAVAVVHTFGGKIVHAVLADSPGARAGLAPRDIVIAINETPWNSIRHLVFSDRRSSELTLKVFVARYFAVANITVRVPPEHYRPIEEIVAGATSVIAAQPSPPEAALAPR
jgi:membrane-associated protease RseP (regulator of RpoE activity)